MDKKIKEPKQFGLLGRNISYSFSQKYFSAKFLDEDKNHCSYQNFDIQSIKKLKEVLKEHPHLRGLNVTIPYKEEVIPLLNKLSGKAKRIGAVNTIRFTKKGKLKGYNTDEYGFRKSIIPFLKKHHTKALILGTGGASKAIAYSLKRLHIDYQFVSRKEGNQFVYNSLTPEIIKAHTIIINCTPLGTYPNIEATPNIPYEGIGEKHLLYDLIYNPEETTFLRKGREAGATVCNGLRMLELQAEKAWEIWNK